jgi:hypothetical protein
MDLAGIAAATLSGEGTAGAGFMVGKGGNTGLRRGALAAIITEDVMAIGTSVKIAAMAIAGEAVSANAVTVFNLETAETGDVMEIEIFAAKATARKVLPANVASVLNPEKAEIVAIREVGSARKDRLSVADLTCEEMSVAAGRAAAGVAAAAGRRDLALLKVAAT